MLDLLCRYININTPMFIFHKGREIGYWVFFQCTSDSKLETCYNTTVQVSETLMECYTFFYGFVNYWRET